MVLQCLNRRIIAQDIIPDDGISHGLSHSFVRWSDGVTTEIDFSIEHDLNIFSSDAVVSTLLQWNALSHLKMRLLAPYMECSDFQSLVIGFALPVNTDVAKLSSVPSHGILPPLQVLEGVDVTSISLMTSIHSTKAIHTTKLSCSLFLLIIV